MNSYVTAYFTSKLLLLFDLFAVQCEVHTALQINQT